MDFSSVLGSMGFGGVSVGSLLNTFWNYFLLFILVLFVGVVGMSIYFYGRRKKGKGKKYQIGWWEEINGIPQPLSMMNVEEITLPGTALKLFYNSAEDRYFPRFSRGITSTLYYVLITPSRQLVNFGMKGITQEMKDLNLSYDHTDIQWASENAREYVKRNFKNKALKWWQVYQQTIAVAGFLVVATFCFVLIIYFMRELANDLSSVVGQVNTMLKDSCMNTRSSGIIPGG